MAVHSFEEGHEIRFPDEGFCADADGGQSGLAVSPKRRAADAVFVLVKIERQRAIAWIKNVRSHNTFPAISASISLSKKPAAR